MLETFGQGLTVTECFFLQVRDGGEASAQLLGKYCNNKLTPYLLKSTSNKMSITFHSDSSFASVFEMSYFILHSDNELSGKVFHSTFVTLF